MEKIETKAKSPQKIIKPISFYYKYNCETCNYHTNFKNSFNKHTKSAKHLSFNPSIEKEDKTEIITDYSSILEEKEKDTQVDRETTSEEDLQTEVVMDSSMGFITVEETVYTDTKKKDIFPYSEYQLNKIFDLMDKLNDKINDDVEMKCIYFGLGCLFHLVFYNLLVRCQWSNFFELSG
jgi:hypothetical protein